MRQLQAIQKQIQQLKQRSAQLDKQRGEQYNALYDARLFQTQSKLLLPYVEEIQQTYATIENIHQSQQEETTGSLERIQYLSEKLIQQIEAVYRELVTTDVRRKEKRPQRYKVKTIHQLYEDLKQHQEWARRLQEMSKEAELNIEQVDASEKAQLQQYILQTDQRLARCQEAIKRIEQAIAHREKEA